MSRNITVYFSDGTAHQYNNAPDKLTPDDIEKRTKKDYPNKKIVRIDGGKSQQLSQSTNLSQFSIKGLKFGMTLDEVYSITKAVRDKVTDSDPKSILYGYKSLEGFSIGGDAGWRAIYFNNKLGSIYNTIDPDNFGEWAEKLVNQYGKPKNVTGTKVGNLFGATGLNTSAYWKVSDVLIYLDKYDRKFTQGSVSIQWEKWRQYERDQEEDKKTKNRKDFE